ncbi:hypothetical protein J437_LFUL006444 [Ladona fulva]|uniref:Uncharacterized protein n=1 Tax=Ladona fulva TaxID=123851 RepID=A0A8K0NYX4_LADFU|nr:hypothetical protein J437_LFUL006444 [Ladona fulva]
MVQLFLFVVLFLILLHFPNSFLPPIFCQSLSSISHLRSGKNLPLLLSSRPFSFMFSPVILSLPSPFPHSKTMHSLSLLSDECFKIYCLILSFPLVFLINEYFLLKILCQMLSQQSSNHSVIFFFFFVAFSF